MSTPAVTEPVAPSKAAPLAPFLDELDRGFIARVAGGALLQGLAWGGLGALVALLIGWAAPKIPSYPYTWIAGLVTGMFALGPCTILGWWSGFAGGVLGGIAQVVEKFAPPLLEKVFDGVEARVVGLPPAQQVTAFSDALVAASDTIRARGLAAADAKGGVMAKFRGALFERIADGVDDAAGKLELRAGAESMDALRRRFVDSVLAFAVGIFLQQKRRTRSIAMAFWALAATLAVVVLSFLR